MKYIWEKQDIKVGVLFGSGANNSLIQIVEVCRRGEDYKKFQKSAIDTGTLYSKPMTAEEMAEDFNKPLNEGDDKGTNMYIYNQKEINERFQWLQDNYYPPFRSFKQKEQGDEN